MSEESQSENGLRDKSHGIRSKTGPGCAFIETDSGNAIKEVTLFSSANTCHRLTMLLDRSTNAMLHIVPEPFNFKVNARTA